MTCKTCEKTVETVAYLDGVKLVVERDESGPLELVAWNDRVKWVERIGDDAPLGTRRYRVHAHR